MDEAPSAFESALVTLDRVTAQALLVDSARVLGTQPSIEKLVVSALKSIGQRWEEGQLALSQVYMSGRICEELIDALLPSEGLGRQHQPRIGLAAFDDYHMLGKRLVHSVLRSAGYDLIDYGRLDMESALRKVEEDRIQVLCLSVLMLPSALHIEALKNRFIQAGFPVKVMVGGAPFRLDARLGLDVGADAVGGTASDAVELVRKLAGELS